MNDTDPNALYVLGLACLHGDGFPQDGAEAARWLAQAGAQGHVEAQFELGQMYRLGGAIPRDIQRAVELYTKAAINGHVEAQMILGVMYSMGRETRLDLVQAHVWYSMARHNGREHIEDLLVELERGMASGQVAEARVYFESLLRFRPGAR